MPAKRYTDGEYNAQKSEDGWNRIVEWRDDFVAFANFANGKSHPFHGQFGPEGMDWVKEIYSEVAAEVGPQATRDSFSIYLDIARNQTKFVTVAKNGELLVWSSTDQLAEDDPEEYLSDEEGQHFRKVLDAISLEPEPRRKRPQL